MSPKVRVIVGVIGFLSTQVWIWVGPIESRASSPGRFVFVGVLLVLSVTSGLLIGSGLARWNRES